MDTELAPAPQELTGTAIQWALDIVDGALKETASTNIVSSAMMTDFLLDIRNLLKPLLG